MLLPFVWMLLDVDQAAGRVFEATFGCARSISTASRIYPPP